MQIETIRALLIAAEVEGTTNETKTYFTKL